MSSSLDRALGSFFDPTEVVGDGTSRLIAPNDAGGPDGFEDSVGLIVAFGFDPVDATVPLGPTSPLLAMGLAGLAAVRVRARQA